MSVKRREFLGGSLSRCHIASLVVQCLPRNYDSTRAAIEALDGAEVPESDPAGKLVVLIEAASEPALLNCIRNIEHTPGVISANLVYHQLDDQEA